MHSSIRTLCPDIFHFSSWFYQHYEHVISQLLVQISAMQCAHEFSRIWNFLRLYVESEVSLVLFNVGLNPNVAFEVDFFFCDSFQCGVGLNLKFSVMPFNVGLNANVCLFVADYGRSFSDVVQGLEHILENLGLDQISTPSSFKYRVALEKQVRLLKSFAFK